MSYDSQAPKAVTINGLEFIRQAMLREQKWLVVWTCIECGSHGIVTFDSEVEALETATQQMAYHGNQTHE